MEAESEVAGPRTAGADKTFHRVFHANPVAMSITNAADGRLVDVNAAFLHLTGYTRDEVLGRTGHELQLWPAAPESDEARRLFQTQGVLRDHEVRYRCKSGDVGVALQSI